jgi:hypothetical protein
MDFLTMPVLYHAKVTHTPSCLRMGLYACISLYLHGAVLRKDSERLNARRSGMKTTMPYWKRLVGEKVLIMTRKHHLVMRLGMDHHHHHEQKRMTAIKTRIVRN